MRLGSRSALALFGKPSSKSERRWALAPVWLKGRGKAVRVNRPGLLSERKIVPRYYFNTRIHGHLIEDPDGEELREPTKH